MQDILRNDGLSKVTGLSMDLLEMGSDVVYASLH